MYTLILDLAFSSSAAVLVLGLGGTGVMALPWSRGEVEASRRAWSTLGAIAADGIRPAPDATAIGNPDDLLPPALRRPSAREGSRARRFGHVRLHDQRVARSG
jgi:hypothetical protein